MRHHSGAARTDLKAGFKQQSLSADEFDELDAILDDLRTRYDETPNWEFCEGFMAALICCRRLITPSEYLPVLLAVAINGIEEEGSFADDLSLIHISEPTRQ